MKKRTCKLHEAKNRLSELVPFGPQTITVRGEPRVVVVAVAEHEAGTGGDRESLLDL